LGWLEQSHRFHDIPARDIHLSGVNVQTSDSGIATVTGAFSPYGQATAAGQVVSGQIPCTGAVMRIPLDGDGAAELVAWGFRNPFGLATSAGGELFVTDQSYDDRGSRPVGGCGDLLWKVRSGLWYGWPDFYGDQPLNSSRQFAPPGKPIPQPLLADYPNTPPAPDAVFPMHGTASGVDFSPGKEFGGAYVAEFGDLTPFTGTLRAPVGFDILQVDPSTGVSHVIAANKGVANGPASKLASGGLERPIALRFDPAGSALYVVDYGVVTVDGVPQSHPGTGVVWKITPEEP
jgi:glucose/arabinose dehydrogenase